MRVVVDTNVFVSSFFGGRPRQVVELWQRGDITLCVSGDLVDEYVEVLRRMRVDSALLDELLRFLASGVNLLFTAAPPAVRVMKEDPDDDKLFACAVALNAAIIVSGDKAVRKVGEYMGIKVQTPTEFLAEFRGAGDGR